METMGNCAICENLVLRDSCYEWTDDDKLLCHTCSAQYDSDELREMGFEVSE